MCKSKYINLAGLGQLEFEHYLMKFTDSRNYQQLRNKKNTAFCNRVYPSAERKRFDHSLGVCYVAGWMFDELMERHPRLVTKKEKTKNKKNIQFAALGHDLGHTPFSHTTEPAYFKFARLLATIQPTAKLRRMIEKCEDHEQVTNVLLQGGIMYPDVKSPAEYIKKAGADPLTVARLVLKGEYIKADPTNTFLQELIFATKFPFDADMLEYLYRDPYFIGLEDKFDIERIVENLRIHTANGRKQLAIRKKALNELEKVVFTSKQLCDCAYLHHTNEKMDAMMVNVLAYFDFKKFDLALGQPITYGDEIFLHELLRLTDGKEKELAQRLYDRDLFDEIRYDELETKEDTLHKLDATYYTGTDGKTDAKSILERRLELQEKLAKKTGISKYDVAVDFREQGCAISEKRDSNPLGEIYVVENNGKVKKLKDPSLSAYYESLNHLKAMPKKAAPLSVYCPEDYTDRVRDAMNEELARL